MMLDEYQLNFFRKARSICVVTVLALLTACASNVVVKGKVPAPLVQKLPLTGSLSYTENFTGYKYTENEKARSLRSLDFGSAQTAMFDQVFGQLLTLVDAEVASKDLTIEPEILDFQYTAPSETKLKQYEVWLKYRVKITDGQDQELADWTIKGYGKTPTGLLTTASAAFNAATNVALRDVGAQLAIGFPKQDSIKSLVGEPAQSAGENSQDQSIESQVSETESAELVEPAVNLPEPQDE